MTKILTPEILAETFVERFEEFRSTGSISTATTYSPEQAASIIKGIRQDPNNMLEFFHQVYVVVETMLIDKYTDPADVRAGLHQLFSIHHSLFLPVIQALLFENEMMIQRINNTVAPPDPVDLNQVFSNLDFDISGDVIPD